jgi:hypothetical protein
MTHYVQIVAAFTFGLILLASAKGHSAGWEPVYEADDVRIERRDYVGSELNEIRGVIRVKASLNAVMALLKDAEFNDRWVYRSGGARILQESGYTQAYVYGVVDAPFPMSDRDTVVRFDYKQDPETREVTIDIRNFPDFVPQKNQFVRVPEMGGYWKLKPEADGWIEVTYQIFGDPGGWIPVWLANRAAEVSVKNTLLNMTSVIDHFEGANSKYVIEAASPDN